jgi:hypothetical protein
MKKRERRKEEKRVWEGERKKKRLAGDARFGKKKRRKESLVIIWCSCVYFVNLSLVELGYVATFYWWQKTPSFCHDQTTTRVYLLCLSLIDINDNIIIKTTLLIW